MRFAFVVWVNNTEEQHLRANAADRLKLQVHIAAGLETLGLPSGRGEIRREDTGQLVTGILDKAG